MLRNVIPRSARPKILKGISKLFLFAGLWGILGVGSFFFTVYLDPFQPKASLDQLTRLNQVQELVNPQFEGVEEISAEIDRFLETHFHLSRLDDLSTQQRLAIEAFAVENWVASHITYGLDRKYRGFPNHYPTPEEVLETRIDDCDGSAILCASLLLHRGIKARLAFNNNHAWAEIVELSPNPGKPHSAPLTISGPAANPLKETEKLVVYPGFSSREAEPTPLPLYGERFINFMQALPAHRVLFWAFSYTFLLSLCAPTHRKTNPSLTIWKCLAVSLFAYSSVLYSYTINLGTTPPPHIVQSL